jgi:hypothetical protein
MRTLKATSTALHYKGRTMIDNFSLALTHILLMLAAWRLLSRPDLDAETKDGTAPAKRGWGRR